MRPFFGPGDIHFTFTGGAALAAGDHQWVNDQSYFTNRVTRMNVSFVGVRSP